MATHTRLRATAVKMTFGVATMGAATLLVPATAHADPGICAGVAAQLAHHGSVNPHLLAAAARANADVIARLTAERSAVTSDVAVATAARTTLVATLAALRLDEAAVGARILQLQSDIATTLADLNVTGLVDRAINVQLGLLSTLPDSPAKTAAIAEQLQARVVNDARRALLLDQLTSQRAQLAFYESQLATDAAAETAAVDSLAAVDAQLAALTTRATAIDAQLALGGCAAA